MYIVRLKGGEEFNCSGTAILNAALAANIPLPYSCNRGECDACQCKLIVGEVTELGVVRMPGELIRTCQALPNSDCELDAEYIPMLQGIDRLVAPAKVSSVNFVNEVAIIKFRTPPSVKFRFIEGQYLDLIYNGIKRSYSIASMSGDSFLELHVKKVIGGGMSEKIFDGFVENTLVRIDGPIGSFFVRDSNRPLIFLATGTGFSPVQAMVSKLLQSDQTRKIKIFWGNRSLSDFYTDLPSQWGESLEHLEYFPVISRGEGPLKYVQYAALNEVSDFSNYDVYACGSSNMIGSARSLLIEHGLFAENFYSDAFVATTN